VPPSERGVIDARTRTDEGAREWIASPMGYPNEAADVCSFGCRAIVQCVAETSAPLDCDMPERRYTMAKKWITLAVLSLGGVAIAIAIYVQSNALAFTSGFTRPSGIDLPIPPVPARLPDSAPEPAVRESVIQMPAVHIIAAPTQPRKPDLRDPESVQPCSPWREMGPVYVEDGVGTGVRRVRDLC
jgi:hypothetical protein